MSVKFDLGTYNYPWAHINPDGSVWFDWEEIKFSASHWMPMVTEPTILVSRLLIAAQAVGPQWTREAPKP